MEVGGRQETLMISLQQIDTMFCKTDLPISIVVTLEIWYKLEETSKLLTFQLTRNISTIKRDSSSWIALEQ
jgi:hypothetical protein